VARNKGDNYLSFNITTEQAVKQGGPAMTAPDEATSQQILAAILKSLDDDKAEDIVQIPLRGKSEMADHMVIASGRSSRQVAAIAEKLTERLKADLGVL